MKRALLLTVSSLLIVSFILTLSLSITAGAQSRGKVEEEVFGDINGDGKLDPTDSILLKRHLLKISLLSGEGFKAADVDENGRLDITDYSFIKKRMLGLKMNEGGGESIAYEYAAETTAPDDALDHGETNSFVTEGYTVMDVGYTTEARSSAPIESGDDRYPAKFGSFDEIPEDLKNELTSELKYTVKINDGNYRLSYICVNQYTMNYFFAPQDENYNVETGFQICFPRGKSESIQNIAARLGYVIDEDGTLFDPAYNLLYVPLDGSVCNVFYPKAAKLIDKSMVTFYKTENGEELPTLSGNATQPTAIYVDETWREETSATETGYTYPANDTTFEPEPSRSHSYEYIVTSESESMLAPGTDTYRSVEELPDTVEFIAEINSDEYRLLYVEIYNTDLVYYFAPVNEDSYFSATGYRVWITLALNAPFDATYFREGIPGDDGTFYYPLPRLRYVKEDHGDYSVRYSIRYPANADVSDTSIISIVKR